MAKNKVFNPKYVTVVMSDYGEQYTKSFEDMDDAVRYAMNWSCYSPRIFELGEEYEYGVCISIKPKV